MTSEQYIQKLADEFELPVEKVAMVWSVAEKLVDIDKFTLSYVVKDLLEELFPE